MTFSEAHLHHQKIRKREDRVEREGKEGEMEREKEERGKRREGSKLRAYSFSQVNYNMSWTSLY
jgi:hypothetical protein